ncbi:MAG: response regulator [Ignavibacteria bacterium]
MKKHTPYVLIIDDEKGLRIGTQRLLSSKGYQVDTAENGRTGIQQALKKDYDLIIIDLKMPDLDGIEVLKEIQKYKPNSVCYIATAYASYETAIEATKLGASGYIPKPFTAEELIKQLEIGFQKRLLLLEAEELRREREQRMLEIVNEKSRLKTILNSIVDGVLVINKNGELVLLNPAAMKYTGCDSVLIGEVILEHLHPKIIENIKRIIESEIFEDKSYSTEVELKPNRELYVEVTCSPVPHPDGTLAGVVVVINNITELKRIELIKSQFVSMVAHELKAPLAAVLGFINLMIDENIQLTEAQRKDYLLRSGKRLRSLVDMVNDLLDISRMEIKTKQRELIDVNLIEIINSILEIMEIEMRGKNISLTFKHPDKISNIYADQNELTRLFTNIISNAIKYNKQNGKIRISIYEEPDYIVTEIEDSGIGLKPEDKEKLFQEFFRVKNEFTRNISGTGLGLSIVKRIVDSYAGKIEVQSTFGEGTLFKVYLPIRKQNLN